MKPAYEPVILARKPGPMRELGIEECRVGADVIPEQVRGVSDPRWRTCVAGAITPKHSGRWPANLILECTCDETREGTAKTGTAVLHRGTKDGPIYGKGMSAHPVGTPDMTYAGPDGKEPVRIHTDPNCPCAMLDGQTGLQHSNVRVSEDRDVPAATWSLGRSGTTPRGISDSGGASRFFYCAKASRSERNAGCDDPGPQFVHGDTLRKIENKLTGVGEKMLRLRSDITPEQADHVMERLREAGVQVA